MRINFIATAVALCLTGAAAAHASPIELVTNGTFEAGLGGTSNGSYIGGVPGWTISGGGPIVERKGDAYGFYAHSGSGYVELGSGGGWGYLSQTLATIPGQDYDLSYWIKGGAQTSPNILKLTWGSLLISDLQNTPNGPYVQYHYIVRAISELTTITFANFENMGAAAFVALDDVSVTGVGTSTQTNTVPEPSSLVLIGAGLLGVAFYARRSKAAL